MGPSFIEAARTREIKDEMKVLRQLIFMQRSMIEELKGRVLLLEEDNKAGMYSPSVQQFTAADAYRKSIEIVENMKRDFWTRSIPNDVAKQWVIATFEDIVRALEHRLNRCEGK